MLVKLTADVITIRLRVCTCPTRWRRRAWAACRRTSWGTCPRTWSSRPRRQPRNTVEGQNCFIYSHLMLIIDPMKPRSTTSSFSHFINILGTNFLFQSVFRSVSLITVLLVISSRKNISAKAAHEMLMKLTPWIQNGIVIGHQFL